MTPKAMTLLGKNCAFLDAEFRLLLKKKKAKTNKQKEKQKQKQSLNMPLILKKYFYIRRDSY